MKKRKQLFVRILLGVACLFAGLLPAASVAAQNVTQGFLSEEPLQKGMIVRLTEKDGDHVEAMSLDHVKDMYGVVVVSNDAPLSFGRSGADRQVYVATFGQYEVLVSTQGGPIKVGDYITVSSLKGVGMKANPSQELILGKALRAFDEKTPIESRATLKTNEGEKTVDIARVLIDLTVSHNPLYADDKVAGVPRFLSRLAGLVTDRPVTALRVYASLGALVLCLFIAGAVLYAAVRTSMTAIGRNPLAHKSIIRNLVQAILMSLIVVGVGVIAVYLLLRI